MNATYPLLSSDDLAMLISKFGYGPSLPDFDQRIGVGIKSEDQVRREWGMEWDEFFLEARH